MAHVPERARPDGTTAWNVRFTFADVDLDEDTDTIEAGHHALRAWVDGDVRFARQPHWC